MKKAVLARAKRIQLILMDVDGVLTDGSLYYGPEGEALKRFSVKDGHGLVMWRIAGGRAGILTARQPQSGLCGAGVRQQRRCMVGLSLR